MLKIALLLLIFRLVSNTSVLRKLKNIVHLSNAILACLYYGFPGRKLAVIGITGTDGKTTTTHLIYGILKTSGKKVSMVSSVYGLIGGREFDTGFHVTTPDPWFVQRSLSEAAKAHDDYFVLEVTSHGLDQNRVWGVPFKIGVLTNITHEHLDYHKTYQKYVQAKAKLLQRSQVVVINREDESFSLITNYELRVTNSGKKVITYGLKQGDITLKNFSFITPLPGEYNKMNCLAAASVGRELGIPDDTIRKALKNFSGVTGRFETIKTKKGFDVIVDFAHTPNAIEKVLATIRPMAKGKLIHVFGSASERDYLKRPIMGAASATYADITILTEEDYRKEDVHKIMDEIEQGYLKKATSKQKLFKFPNRQDAVNKAISLAKKGDIVILTGKGHEKSLCRGTVEYPWSEHEAVKKALQQL